ncbi:hypothetical protein AVEN_50074-1 [Araneus ventricosus]|uniref:Peptidase A2 domain-containing protein n=1 Tax=Araneus ventricosus TaxID=182803 RepID=A0A4Y2G9Y4_ARAVE|nr:hypothetical protein AVEN_50074-1 [Araneus ventricosus]
MRGCASRAVIRTIKVWTLRLDMTKLLTLEASSWLKELTVSMGQEAVIETSLRGNSFKYLWDHRKDPAPAIQHGETPKLQALPAAHLRYVKSRLIVECCPQRAKTPVEFIAKKEELEEKQRQEALAELRRKDEVELERLKIEAQLKLGTTTTEADYFKLPSKEVSKFLHRFEVKEDISLYLVRRFKDPEKESNTVKPKKATNSTKEINKSAETCAIIGKESLRTKEAMFGNKRVKELIDIGSTVSLLRENTSRRIIDPTKLAKNIILLTGIGEAQVTTIGSFEQEFQMGEDNYSSKWHVVPIAKLKFEAVIGSDILEQASVNFTKNGVEFVTYENQTLLMQISAENIEEVELNHIRDLKVKTELKKLIENYKPGKTATTDVTMRIILKDDEPICQSPRRLAFTEREEVNKQIEEWLKESIIRPSSSEYASPIVLVRKKDGTSKMCIDS